MWPEKKRSFVINTCVPPYVRLVNGSVKGISPAGASSGRIDIVMIRNIVMMIKKLIAVKNIAGFWILRIMISMEVDHTKTKIATEKFLAGNRCSNQSFKIKPCLASINEKKCGSNSTIPINTTVAPIAFRLNKRLAQASLHVPF